MILKNLVFLPHLLICRQEVFSPIPQNKYQMTSIDDTLNGSLYFKKKAIVMLWPRDLVTLSHMSSYPTIFY